MINDYVKNIPNKPIDLLNLHKISLDHALKDCKKYHTDYVVMSAHLSCCAECNKLQGRVYSISGKSNIFPKLPDVILKTGRVHPKCRHNISTYFFNNDGTDTIRDKNGRDVDAIKASQRPYIQKPFSDHPMNMCVTLPGLLSSLPPIMISPSDTIHR